MQENVATNKYQSNQTKLKTVFTHLLGVDKVSSGAKTRVGIGYNGDSDDDGKGEESLGNHFVCGWIFTL